MLQSLETALLSLVHTLPLEVFVFVASFLEEVIAPIPSPAVLLTAGSIAAIQERTLLGLIPIILIATLGKTIGALLIYYFSDKIGQVIFTKYGHFFNTSHESITKLGSKITDSPRDYLLLTLFRALPIFPSSVLSIGCGLLKLPLPLFIITTFFGTVIRDGFFLYVGFKGTVILNNLALGTSDIESFIQMAILIVVVIIAAYFYFQKKSSSK
jgi:membrane protein DedA with SNARE-associated domain